MELTSFDASKFALTALIVVVLVATLFSALEKRFKAESYSKASNGRTFVGAVAAIAILYQCHLIVEISTNFRGASLYRLDCLHSNKGGKRPLGATSNEYWNPCYIAETNTSTSSTSNGTDLTDETGIESNSIYVPTTYSMCPSSKISTDSSVYPFISEARDCHRGQRSVCSISQPCTPCEISRFSEFHNSSRGWTRCQTCGLSNKHGACNFKDGVGPYCWMDATSFEVIPCQRCCTDGMAIFDEKGICH